MEEKNTEAEEQMKQGAREFLKGIYNWFYDLIDLRDGLDRQGTIKNIQNNKRMRGANAWLLICSILVASLGLNLNSPAVIIGAMLISPLMSPILGVGLSIGINDRRGFVVSLQHFGISIAIALITSYLYFKFTPLDAYTPEINARTQPTILDVMIAFFGGVAGIVSGSRIDKSNAIPGVAIATALMPPLCVTGYGLANGIWMVALNSFYLFFLNATFVALATYIFVLFMQFPQRGYQDKKEALKTRLIFLVFSMLVVLPSVYIFVGVMRTISQQQKIESYIETHFPDASEPIIEKDNFSDTLRVDVTFFKSLSPDTLSQYLQELNNLNYIAVYKITAIEDDGISKEEFEHAQLNMRKDFLRSFELERVKQVASSQAQEKTLSRLDSLTNDTLLFPVVYKELQALYPDLVSVSYGRMQMSYENDSIANVPTLEVRWNPKKSVRNKKSDEVKIEQFLKLRLDKTVIRVVERSE